MPKLFPCYLPKNLSHIFCRLKLPSSSFQIAFMCSTLLGRAKSNQSWILKNKPFTQPLCSTILLLWLVRLAPFTKQKVNRTFFLTVSCSQKGISKISLNSSSRLLCLIGVACRSRTISLAMLQEKVHRAQARASAPGKATIWLGCWRWLSLTTDGAYFFSQRKERERGPKER